MQRLADDIHAERCRTLKIVGNEWVLGSRDDIVQEWLGVQKIRRKLVNAAWAELSEESKRHALDQIGCAASPVTNYPPESLILPGHFVGQAVKMLRVEVMATGAVPEGA